METHNKDFKVFGLRPVVMAALGLLLVAGCASSIQKAELSDSVSVQEEMRNIEAGISEGYVHHYDVLAQDDFNQSILRLNSAKQRERQFGDSQDVLDDVAYSIAYLRRAKSTAMYREPKAQGVLDSRRDALQAGAQSFPTLRDRLNEVDNDLRSNVKDLDRDLTARDFGTIQKGYQDIELAAIQSTHIGNAQAMIIGAKNDGAARKTPKTLRTAEIDFENAENTILANRHNPAAFQSAVARANDSARFLVDVVADSNSRGAKWNETSSARFVRQNYNQNSKTKNYNGSYVRTWPVRQDAIRNPLVVDVRSELERARTQLASNDVEVFQRGNQLLIRLNAVGFQYGHSELPQSSLAMLSKVRDIANHLTPSMVTVESHTNSTGNAKANQTLSGDRALAVASYLQSSGLRAYRLESIGFGEERPIATNTSPEGRDENQRVDIVITPGYKAL